MSENSDFVNEAEEKASDFSKEAEEKGNNWTEKFDVAVDQLAHLINEAVAKGNVRNLKIRHEGRTILDIPLTAAVVGGAAGAIMAPLLAAVVAVAGIVARVELVIERQGNDPSLPAGKSEDK